MDALLALTMLIAAAGAVGLLLIEQREQAQRRRTWRTVRLRFGRDVSSESVLAVLDRMAGLHAGVVVSLDLRADASGIEHFLSTDQATLETLRGGLRAVLPSLRLDRLGDELPQQYGFGRAIRLDGRLGTLRTGEHEATAAALLAALLPLGATETVLVRWTLRPGRARALRPQANGDELPTEHRRLLQIKNARAVLRARGAVAVEAGHPERARHLIARVSAVLRSRRTAHGHLREVPRSAAALQRAIDPHALARWDRYGIDELAGLLGWPIGAPPLPGVHLGTSPLLMPSARLPRGGRIHGAATWPGDERPVAQPVLGALSHALITGPTGVGKSTLLTNVIAQDAAAGRGLVLIDGKGDTAQALLARLPKDRRNDVIVLDCASTGALPGIQLFGAGSRELAADVVLGVLSDLFKGSWGPLSERYLRAGLVAVAHDEASTLADVPFVYSDAAYRRRLMARLHDPLTKSTLSNFEAMGAGERSQQLAAPLNKLGSLLGRPVVRTVLGQARPQLDFREVLAHNQIVVVSLAPARVGSAASRLIGAVVVFALFQAIQSRSQLPERARRPFMVAIDEPKALGDLHMPLDALLEQARGLGVGIILSPQSVGQLGPALREAALTNAATRIVFRQNADDARVLARDLGGVTPEDLQDLAAFEAVARIGLGPGDVAAPVTIKTAPLVKPTSDPAALRATSEARYGQTLEQVDAALQARHRLATDGPVNVGRRARRAS